MGDEKHQRDRGHRLTSRPADGSVQAKAIAEGAPLDPPFAPSTGVPVGEFADLATNPVASDFETMQARVKTSAYDTRELLLIVKDLAAANVQQARANTIRVDAEVQIDVANNSESIEKKRWTREQVGKFLAVFTSGAFVSALLSLLMRQCV